MIKFKKVFSTKVISLFISVLFFLNSTVYGIDTPIKSYLRVPVAVNSKEGRSRLIDSMKQVARTMRASLSPAAAAYGWLRGALKKYDEKVIIFHASTGAYYFISGGPNQIIHRDRAAGKNLFYDWRRPDHRREIQKLVIENPELMEELVLRKREHPAGWLTFQRNWELSRDPEVMKSYLYSIAGRIWHFFDAFVDAKHPFPPDYILEVDKDAIPAAKNLAPWQEIVVYEGAAFLVERKISPTNIGFYMTSILCAWKLGFIDENEARNRINRSLTALEGIKTFKGMTFNWLDESFQPIYGGFISTVDSGNLAVILMFLQVFFPAYEDRIDNLLQAMDFDAFFDHEKGLFYGGGREEGNKLRLDDKHWYDFFASESLLLNLAARLLKKVDEESWTNLAIRKDGSILPPDAVWMPARGTMFEGTLWGLFIDPSQLNDEMRRGLKWYIDQQVEYGYKKGMPWGLSECAVAVEKEHNYAVVYGGTQVLTLSAFPDEKWAYSTPSPYSTCLALVLRDYASEAFDNLHLFEERGALTSFGFYEALGIKGLEGRSMFFAHHQGMSLMALANYYLNGELQKVLSRSKYNHSGTIEELLSQPPKAYSVWGRKRDKKEEKRTDRHGYPEDVNIRIDRKIADSL
ncbi:MAG: DUF3131 domain-containing protein [Candidatus Omnitrophica bacterium]|nr:DUF3131 domain-containing protein [Candidatus Omnitrophota bacterium]